jgi:hypothetical protein
VAPDRAVGHQAVFEEDLLARADIGPGEEDLACGIDDLLGNGWRLAIGLGGQPDQDRKAEQHGDDRKDPPPERKRLASRSLCCRHGRSPVERSLAKLVLEATIHRDVCRGNQRLQAPS